MTFLSALRVDGITVLCVFDCPISGESVLFFVEHFLIPTLWSDGIVIMDNIGSHKTDAVKQAIELRRLSSQNCRQEKISVIKPE